MNSLAFERLAISFCHALVVSFARAVDFAVCTDVGTGVVVYASVHIVVDRHGVYTALYGLAGRCSFDAHLITISS